MITLICDKEIKHPLGKTAFSIRNGALRKVRHTCKIN